MSTQRALQPTASLEAGHRPEEMRWAMTGSLLTLHGRVPCDLFHVAGHFPENPLVPGFVVVSWALAALERARERPLHLRTMKKMKFLRALRPGDAFVLRMELGISSSGQRQAAFSFLEDSAGAAPLQEVPICAGVFEYDEGNCGDN